VYNIYDVNYSVLTGSGLYADEVVSEEEDGAQSEDIENDEAADADVDATDNTQQAASSDAAAAAAVVKEAAAKTDADGNHLSTSTGANNTKDHATVVRL